MKRGLIFWDRKAWPEDEFHQKIELVKAAMLREGLDAVLIYGDACQSGDLSYLTHFIPYADTGVFVLPAKGPPRLFTTHALRNMAWFRTITWVEDIICTNRIGPECAEYIGALGGACKRIGIVPGRTFPYAVSTAVAKQTGCALMDFTGAYEQIRAIKSDRELEHIGRAAGIAAQTLECLSAGWQPGISGFDVAARAEREARTRGAEDLFCFIQADGAAEGLSLPKAEPILRYAAIEMAVEYNGYWAKIGRTVVVDKSFDALRVDLERFTKAYFSGLDAWFAGHTLMTLNEAFKAVWGGPVQCQVDYGLEPYWGTRSLFEGKGSGVPGERTVMYLQTSAVLPSPSCLVRTDTIVFLDGRLHLITR